MKALLTISLLVSSTLGIAQSGNLKPGTAAPDFSLKNVTGETISFATFQNARGYIVVFTCNTCPVAKGYEERIIALNKKYAPLGFPVIAINPNDPSASPGDSYAKMVDLANAHKFDFPYLYDDGQKVTTAYGARNTPHIFLVKHTGDANVVVYTGAIDNDPEGGRPDRVNYLEQAIGAVMDGKDPAVASTKAIGCSVRWKAR